MDSSGIDRNKLREILQDVLLQYRVEAKCTEVATVNDISDIVIFSHGCFKTKEPFRQLTVIGNINENSELLTD